MELVACNMALGKGWVSKDPQTKRTTYLKFKAQYRESFAESWEDFKEYVAEVDRDCDGGDDAGGSSGKDNGEGNQTPKASGKTAVSLPRVSPAKPASKDTTLVDAPKPVLAPTDAMKKIWAEATPDWVPLFVGVFPVGVSFIYFVIAAWLCLGTN